MTILEGRTLLITGVVTTDSIAFSVARRAIGFGADVVLTALDRDRVRCEQAASELGVLDVFDLDVTRPADFERLEQRLRAERGHLDGALHAVAFAPRDALAGSFLAATEGSVAQAFATSAYSFASLARVLASLAPDRGASLVGLDFDAAAAWPVYNWMGVCKSALESINRYVARDLGAKGIRSNLVAAGPLHTRAANGIPNFNRLLSAWEERAPLAWDPTDNAPVADAVCFLMSDLGRAVTGEILHVDGGYHAIAAPLR
ncbi:enoyl-ACP reductase FabI [Dermatobacter hominis]|uniref:enoyl-ACP reductase FabI n=1 Tax=Dermatobacter hominis TaxID=2884263 RepID=UPI001D114826|nr:enoyl-ACP reductase FabI [Dermatobacter hominis]UDY37616.1 enoyl-ACP reductase FabI [Dermatobacter hominis]